MTTTGNFMFAWAGLCAFLQVSQNANIEATAEIQDAKNIVSNDSAPPSSTPNSPCFMDDVLATLRESLKEDGHVRNDSIAQFSVCTENSPMFLQLAQDASSEKLDVMIPTQVVLRKETNKRVLVLTFGPTKPPQTMLNPAVLLFPSESIFKMSGIRFTSQLLNPSTQTPCTSEDSRYILLTGNNQSFPPTWDIVMQTSSDTNVVDREDSSSTISIFALLLFSSRGTDTRPPNNNYFSHNSFLCELRHFLVQSTPQDHHAPLLNLGLLRSLPSQPIGLASSESLLADLINSSAPTILSFTQGFLLHVHHEELALSPILLQELGQKLGQVLEEVSQVMEAVEDGRVRGRLDRLKRLSGFPFADRVGGKLQYRAFLLFKALQMVRRAFNPPRAQRSTRANPNAPSICGLKTLTVSLERYLISPNTADIKNCRGMCAFPMGLTRNHAVLLNSHIESGHSSERAPCCVPVAYDKMEVVDLGELGTTLKTEPDMVATACECR